MIAVRFSIASLNLCHFRHFDLINCAPCKVRLPALCYQTRRNAHRALALVLIRSARLLDQGEVTVPHLICPRSWANNSRLKQKEETDVKKKRQNGKGIQSRVIWPQQPRREGRKGKRISLMDSVWDRRLCVRVSVAGAEGRRTGAGVAKRLAITATDERRLSPGTNPVLRLCFVYATDERMNPPLVEQQREEKCPSHVVKSHTVLLLFFRKLPCPHTK